MTQRFKLLKADSHPWKYEIVVTRAELLELLQELEGDTTINGFIYPLQKIKR